MRKLILTLLLAPVACFGQTHQAEILGFVNANLGKKIGKGYCYELVQGAFRQYIPNCDMQRKDYYGKKISRKDVQPGDLVRMKGKGLSHIAIIYMVEGSKITVAEQNTRDVLRESVVEINPFREDWLVEYYDAEFSFFRPE